MNQAAHTYRIVLGTTCMEITPNPTASNNTELIPKAHIVTVDPVKINQQPAAPNAEAWKYRFVKMICVVLGLSDGNSMQIELQEVTGQAGWTANLAGQQQCIADIKAWL